MKSKKRITGIYIFSMIVILGFSTTLCGCRKSEVLEDVVVDEDAALLNDQEAMSIEKDGEDQNKQNNQEQDSENKKDWEDVAALNDETADSSEANTRNIHSSNTEDGTASEDGHTQTDDDAAGNGTNSDGTGSGDGSGHTEYKNSDGTAGNAAMDSESDDSNDNRGDPIDDSANNTNPSDGNQNPTSKKNGPRKTVTDGNGIEQSIPEDVHTVTAVGEAASVVEMLGGSGRLLASSEDVTSNSLCNTLFEDVASGEVKTWWSGDGSTQISDANFEELLQASPDVCFEISGEQTFSADQINTLEEAGIGYLTLPAFSTVENIEEAVLIVANALETNESTGKNALKIAAAYNDWVENAIEEVEDASKETETMYTLFISEWRDDISFERMYGVNGENYPYLNIDYAWRDGYIVDFPESTGIVNGKGSGVAIAWDDKFYPLPTTSLWLSANVESIPHSRNQYYDNPEHIPGTGKTGWYIFPYEERFGYPVFSSDEYYYYYMEQNNMPAIHFLSWGIWSQTLGLYYGRGAYVENSRGECNLGTALYPAIIVANEEIKEKIEASAQWKPRLIEGDNGVSDIMGDYGIYVNPTGLSAWADGSVDTPLEVYWIANKIRGNISNNVLKTRVKSFYQTFFGKTLTDQQINDIVNK